MAVAKKVLRYVITSQDLRMHYSGNRKVPGVTLHGYVDSDWAESDNSRKSTTGFVMFFNSSLVRWCFKKQQQVATSTAVAEYLALYEAALEVISSRHLLADLGYPQTNPSLVREDNTTCMEMTREDAPHKRTKHIDIRYHFTKEEITKGNLMVKHVSSESNLTDTLTKPLSRERFEALSKLLGLF